MRMTPCLRADRTVFDVKPVVAHSSMVYLPYADLAVHTSTAKWTHVNKTFLCDNAILHRKSVPADGAVRWSIEWANALVPPTPFHLELSVTKPPIRKGSAAPGR